MSDDQGKGPGPDDHRFDAVERLRRKFAESRAAETGSREPEDGTSNVVRLPRRPRRRQEEAGPTRRRPPIPDGGYDPAETRPVTRAELQRESGSFPVNEAAEAETDPSDNPDHEADLIDLEATRRKRAGGARRMARPRRIGPADTARGEDGAAGSPRPDDPDR
ncbi:hypothetical protein [Nocardia sp. A7]|uniref:hypothetical protein n=1 Tax=Nocardia sp. A7 TaxID=2789274 RepID=UPI00397A77E6